MKYTNVPAFKRQIEAAYQKEMPRVYLILAESAFERARLLDYVLCYLPHPNAYSVFRYAGEEADAAKIISALSSPSLFGGRPLLILDDAAALAKDTVRRLSEFIKEPFGGYLVMGASAKGALLPLLREVESCGMLLDLLAEKPWEKEKRLADFLQAECAKACKTLEKQASSRLLEFAGLDMSALFREINKLIAFVGERAVITAEDVLAVCYRSHQNTIWQLAEELVWNRNLIIDERWEASFFHGLVAAVRYQLQLGLKLAVFVSQGIPYKDVESHFIKLHPKTLLRRKEQAAALSADYFERALICLFDIDLLSKNNAAVYHALVTLFFNKTCPELRASYES